MRTSPSRFVSALALTLILAATPLPIVRTAHASHSQCSDGVDNDNDTRVDYPVDNDCLSIDDNNEGIDEGIFVTVSDNRDQVAAGDAVIYVITLKQQRETVKLVDVSLHVPPQASIVYASDGGSIRDGTSVFWPKVAVFRDNVRRITVHAVMSPYATQGQLIVARTVADGVPATDTTMIVNNQIPYIQNMLTVTITDNRDNARPGEILNYVLRVRNPENRATTVDVKATLPPVLTLVNGSTDGEWFGRDVFWRGITFGPGQERAFTFSAQIDPRVINRYPIQVVARAGGVVANDRTVIGGTPFNLFASISDGRDTARRGDLLTYVIHVDNTSGRLDTNAYLSAGLPIHAEFVSTTEGGRWDGKNVRWENMHVAPGGTRDLRFTIRVRGDAPSGTVLRGTVFVQGAISEDETTVVGDSFGFNGGSVGQSVRVAKVSSAEQAAAGSTLTYAVGVRNAGTDTATNVTVEDMFDPSQVTVIDPGSGMVTPGRVMWNIGSLQPGESRVLRYTVRLSRDLNRGDDVINTARVYSSSLAYIPAAVSTVEASGILMPVTGVEKDGTQLPLFLWIGLIAGIFTLGTKKYAITR